MRYFVAVAEEQHFGRAARRLHMTQPPLSRGIKQLETDLAVALFERTSRSVELTPAGSVLYPQACALLEHAEQVRAVASAMTRATTLVVGTLGDTAEQIGERLVGAFRRRHRDVDVRIAESDLADPTLGLRAGRVDVALTRAPFEDDGIRCEVLRSDPVGVVLRTGDPLATRKRLHLDDLKDHRWFRLPDDVDPTWRAYWNGDIPADQLAVAPIARTVQECLQAALWTGRIGLAPVRQSVPDGLVVVPLADKQPSDLVVAWDDTNPNSLVHSFRQIAATIAIGNL